jgi:hypothetical protein
MQMQQNILDVKQQESIAQKRMAQAFQDTIDILSGFTRDFLGIRNEDSRLPYPNTDMSEKAFSTWLRAKLPGMIQRIETTTGAGVPDIWCGFPSGNSCWIETKVVTHKRVLLRKEQWAWMVKANNSNQVVLVVAFEPKDETVLVYHNSSMRIERYTKYLSITSVPKLLVGKRMFNYGLLESIL